MKSRKVKNNRITWIHLRLSLDEHQLLVKRRNNTTCRNLSHYLRDILFNRPVVATYRNISQDDIVHQMVILNRELNSIGNNLNQVTKKLHTLHSSEDQFWGVEFITQAQDIRTKIIEIKEAVHMIAERWLR